MAAFAFHALWSLPATQDIAYEVLADVEGYPLWWPQVRGARRIDAASGHARVRSFMPWTLDLVLTREIEDPVARVLRVGLAGDLAGWCEWRLRPAARASGLVGSVAEFSQEVTVTAPALARASRIAAPVLRANHDWMMRQGQRGLVARLAGGRAGPSS